MSIQLRNVVKTFGSKTVLHDVSLDIVAGQVVGICGLSGCGKSTLLRILAGLESVDSGEVRVAQAVGSNIITSRKVGLIFQQAHVLESRSVLGNITFALKTAGKNVMEAEKLLQLVGLKQHAHRYPCKLSGGERQRVAIAKAVAAHPEVLLCDEVTSALDPHTSEQILSLLRSVNDMGITIVFVSHHMEVVKAFCPQVAVLHEGKIIDYSSIQQLMMHPSHEVTQKLFSVPLESCIRCQEGEKIVQLWFEGEQAKRSVMTQLIKECGVDVNILQGKIEHVAYFTLGHLYVLLSGTPQALDKAFSFLESQQILYQEVYVT